MMRGTPLTLSLLVVQLLMASRCRAFMPPSLIKSPLKRTGQMVVDLRKEKRQQQPYTATSGILRERGECPSSFVTTTSAPMPICRNAQTTNFAIPLYSSVDESSSNNGEEPTTSKKGIGKFFGKYFRGNSSKDDGLTFRQRLAKMGLATVLSYGWVSNMSYCISVSLAWYGFSVKTGKSPLFPEQWKPFLAVYAGFYVFNNIVRPIRLALSVAVSPYFDKFVNWIQQKTNWSRAASIGITVFVVNVIGTTALMCGGIAFAAALAGVPVFPPK